MFYNDIKEGFLEEFLDEFKKSGFKESKKEVEHIVSKGDYFSFSLSKNNQLIKFDFKIIAYNKEATIKYTIEHKLFNQILNNKTKFKDKICIDMWDLFKKNRDILIYDTYGWGLGVTSTVDPVFEVLKKCYDCKHKDDLTCVHKKCKIDAEFLLNSEPCSFWESKSRFYNVISSKVPQYSIVEKINLKDLFLKS